MAIQLAQKVQEQVCGLILENTFCSISDMVDHIFPLLSYFKQVVQRIYWPSIDRIPSVKSPMLFLVGMNDEIVPSGHANRLYEAAQNAAFKQIYQVQGGMHNDTWLKGGKDYIYVIKDFIDKAWEFKTSKDNSSSNRQNYMASSINQGGVANQGGLVQRRHGNSQNQDFN